MILISESFFLFFRKNPRQCRVKRSYCKRSRCIISMKTRFSLWSTGEFNDRWKRAACPLSPQDTKGMIPLFLPPPLPFSPHFPFRRKDSKQKAYAAAGILHSSLCPPFSSPVRLFSLLFHVYSRPSFSPLDPSYICSATARVFLY